MTVKIIIPDNNTEERKYIIDLLFSDFLGLKYNIKTGDVSDYIIRINNKTLVIRDKFFNSYKPDISYLNKNAIPEKIKYLKNEFIPEENIPVIYGTEEILSDSKSVTCGIDIFASAFFMLTRWEEYVSDIKDQYNRFPDKESLAVKHRFNLRPVVNEYIEMLWNMLVYLGCRQKRKTETFRIIPTHDVDRIFPGRISQDLSSFMKRKQVKRFAAGLYYSFFRVNSFDSFWYIMEQSEIRNLQSRFYFLCGNNLKYENYYDMENSKVLKTASEIIKRNHVLGFHPGYNTYNNEEAFYSEKQFLEETLDVNINEGRQHFLRFENPTTWDIWDKQGMNIDSTMGYSTCFGFRCGTANIYNVFNILTRKKLNLKEMPMIIMETVFKQPGNRENRIEEIKILREKAEKYSMPFTVIFHNHSFDKTVFNDFKEIYEYYILG